MLKLLAILVLVQAVVNGLPSSGRSTKLDKATVADAVLAELLPDGAIITNINNLLVNINTLTVIQNGVEVSVERNDRDLDWWETTIFYQIYPRSFMDSNGDGIGDINGITSKLDHLKDLGIGATWLSPIFKSPMYDFGYDISNFYEIQEEYGTMEDFENLLAKGKELGIKIILDFVPNHSSNESEWFEKSLERDPLYGDYFIWEKGTVDANGNRLPPNNWVSVFRKSAWEYRPERDEFYLHQFAVGQPDLNFRNEKVVEEMKNVLRFWLEKGVHGFRIDAINHLFEVDKNLYGGAFPDEPLTGYLNQGPDDYGYVDHIYTKDQPETYDMVYQWREIFDEFSKEGDTKVIMTESYTDIKDTMRYYGEDDRTGSHMPFNFGLISDANAYSTAKDIKHIIDRWITYMPLGLSPNWVLGNHDQRRVASRYGTERVDGLNMVLLSLPGVSVTYMGEEIGMLDGYVSWEDTLDPQACNTDDPINGINSSRDPARTPYQWSNQTNSGFSDASKTWLPVGQDYATLNLEDQKNAERSHYKVYKAVSQLRAEPTYMQGDFRSVAFNDDVFAFTRSYAAEPSYVTVWNLANKEDTVDLTYFSGLTSQLKVVVTNMDSPRNIGDSVISSALTLSPYESLVLKST